MNRMQPWEWLLIAIIALEIFLSVFVIAKAEINAENIACAVGAVVLILFVGGYFG